MMFLELPPTLFSLMKFNNEIKSSFYMSEVCFNKVSECLHFVFLINM
ncbi:hypothetical protein SPHINGO8BC_150745 [Sphingobacterium multivorum]|uniref:Uncharacterized protein n=1 Tax=Sphingobacterium multivorum TaxID=28454 RepID=A0A654B1P0_SPHMU|nr:hypothetical protein SPHINGO8BC_150745 [Sphingobacterium multivorum]